jgi:hypothetical protein
MNSLFTGEPSDRTVEGRSKEDLVRSRFVDSVDILQKMKAIQLRKNQMGHVPHTYSVLKEQKHKEGNRFRQSEDTTKKRHSSLKKESEPILKKEEAGARVRVEQAKLSQQIVKEKKFRLRNEMSLSRESPRLSRSNTNFLLTRTEEMRPITDRPMQLLKPGDLLKTFQISKSSVKLKPLVIIKADEDRESAQIEQNMNIVDVAEREVQRRELYRRQISSLAQTNKELRSKIAGKLKPTVRKSFLERIELRNQIPVALPPTELQFDESPSGSMRDNILKMGNIINEASIGEFEEFISLADTLKSKFPGLKVRDLYDYSKAPIEQFDGEFDPRLDMEYFLEQNSRGQSRWASKEGKIAWRPCTVLSYDRSDNRFVIRWDESAVQKKVTRLNLLFPGESAEDFDRRSLRANRLRAFHVLAESSDRYKLTREMLAENRVTIDFDRLLLLLEAYSSFTQRPGQT